MSVLAAINPRPILAGPSVPGMAGAEAGAFVTRVVPFSHLFRHDFEIEALNRQAIRPNVFYHPVVLAALAQQCPPRGEIRLVMVHGRDGVLRAMAPVVSPSAAAGGRLRLGSGFCGPLHPDATPLIDGATPEAADTLVAGLMQAGGAVFDHVDLDGPVARLLKQAAERKGLKALCHGEQDRTGFASDGSKTAGNDRRVIKSARTALSKTFGRLRYNALSDAKEIEAALTAANEMDRLAGLCADLSAGSAVQIATDNGLRSTERAVTPAEGPPARGLIGRLLRGQEDAPLLSAHRLQGGRTDLAIAITLSLGDTFWLWRLAIKPGAARKLAGLVLADMAERRANANFAQWSLEGNGFGAGADFGPYAPRKRRYGHLIVASPFRADAERAMGRLAHAARNLSAPQ
jgi:hypothetical protein